MFGEILQELRKDRGMTQRELGQLLSLTSYTISAYECGRSIPDDETKIRIARIFNVSLDYLFGLIREPIPFDRTAPTLRLPDDFSTEEIQKVREYIAFLQYTKKKQCSHDPKDCKKR